MNNPLLSFLGIAKKSGNLMFGMDPVKKELFKKSISLILVTKDISENSLKKIQSAALDHGIKVLQIIYTKEDIQPAIGKYSAIIGVKDINIANKFNSIIGQDNTTATVCENNREEYSL